VKAPWHEIIHSREVFSKMAREEGVVSSSRLVVAGAAQRPAAWRAAPNFRAWEPTSAYVSHCGWG